MRLLIIILAMLCAAGCGRSPGERIAAAALFAVGDGKIGMGGAGQTVSMNTAQGNVQIAIGADARLPADFPKDVYLPGDYAIGRVVHIDEATIIELDAAGNVAELAAQAQARMLASGWKRARTLQPDADTRALAWEKGARAVVISLAGNTSRGTDVHLQFGPKR